MNNKGFTLIELMIVIAILGILVGNFSDPLSFYTRQLKFEEKSLENGMKQSLVFYCMKKFLDCSATIKKVTSTEVYLSNNKHFKVDKDKKSIIFIDGKKINTIDFGDAISFSEFIKTDYLTFSCYIKLGDETIPMFWRVGK